MGSSRIFTIVTVTVFLFTFSGHPYAAEDGSVYGNHKFSEAKEPIIVNLGLVLDLSSPLGSMAHSYIKKAILDFYKAHPNYMTRLHLHARSAESVGDISAAVLKLVKNEKVQAVLFGPQTESANSIVAEHGKKFHVPIISFTARSSRYNSYFVRATPDDVLQARALAAMCKEFEWTEVVVLYEDMDHGNQFLSHLHKAFREVEIGLASMIAFHVSDNDMHLLEELRLLKEKMTRVFLVHMNPLLGHRFFTVAKEVGLMIKGCAWIITDSLSNFLNSIDSGTRDSMQGIVGLRPYVHNSVELKAFQERWKGLELNVYGLWAYDATTALSIAVENIEEINSNPFHAETDKSGADLKIQTFAQSLLYELSTTEFRGLTGNFKLAHGKLEWSTYEIFNLYGSGEKNMGFWTPGIGITKELISSGRATPSSSSKGLNIATWPGDSTTQPNGLSIPTNGKLRVGILLKKGFREFVDVTDPIGNSINATGFAIDIFKATLRKMPTVLDYEFRLYNGTNNSDWSYDDILHEIPKNFDMFVGATTVWAPRAEYVHFSLPYSESGAIMVVRNKKPDDMWSFTKPLSRELWLAIILLYVITILVIWRMERHSGKSFLSSVAAPLLAIIFADRNMVKNNWSLVVLLVAMFVSYILNISYNAIYTSNLTIDQLEVAYSDKFHVGYQKGSFMKQFLIENLHISETRLKSYSSPEEYHHAMMLGSINGGIDVIFDEIPYMRILLKKYGSEYKMVLPIYKTGGFGFAFPIGSSLVIHFSKAILDVTQGPEMAGIENKNFGAGYTSLDPLASTVSQRTSSLGLSEFYGLFIFYGFVITLSLVFSETNIIGYLKMCISWIIFGYVVPFSVVFLETYVIRFLKMCISRINDADNPSAQQSGTGPSHPQRNSGANTSGEADKASVKQSDETSPLGQPTTDPGPRRSQRRPKPNPKYA